MAGGFTDADLQKAMAFYSGQPQPLDLSNVQLPQQQAPAPPPPAAPTPSTPVALNIPKTALDPTFGLTPPKTSDIPAVDPAQALAFLKQSHGAPSEGAFGLPTQSQAKMLPEVTIKGDPKNSPPEPPKMLAPVTIQGSPARAGGGAPANPDPFGVKADQKAVLGTYDTEKGLTRDQGQLEASKALHVGDEMGRAARDREQDAAIMHAEAEERGRIFDQHIEETQRQLDEVREKKIEPFRMLDDAGSRVMTVIGGALGGAYMGLNHMDHNPFLDDLNKRLDRDMAAQRENISNQKEALQGRMSLLKSMQDKYKDETLAKLQARNLGYEAAKEATLAEASQYDSPIIQNRAELAVTAIDRAQKGLKTDIDKAAAASAAAQAAAASAQAKAAQKDANERSDKIYTSTLDKALGSGMSPAEADRYARHAVATLMAPNGAAPYQGGASGAVFDPVAAVPKDQRHEAGEEQKRASAAKKAVQALKDTFANYEAAPDLPTYTAGKKRDAVLASGLLNVRSALGEGFSSDKDTQKYVESNLPSYGESADARKQKLEGLIQFVEGRAATPTLDRYSPGWRDKDTANQAAADASKVKHFNADGSPKK